MPTFCFYQKVNTNLAKPCDEASSHDRINMTKLWLENDQKMFTTMDINHCA